MQFCETGYKLVTTVACDTVSHLCKKEDTCVQKNVDDYLIPIVIIIGGGIALIQFITAWRNCGRALAGRPPVPYLF